MSFHMYYVAYRHTPSNNPILIIRSLYTAKCIRVSQEINFNDLWWFWDNFRKYESNIRLFTGFVFTSSMTKNCNKEFVLNQSIKIGEKTSKRQKSTCIKKNKQTLTFSLVNYQATNYKDNDKHSKCCSN